MAVLPPPPQEHPAEDEREDGRFDVVFQLRRNDMLRGVLNAMNKDMARLEANQMLLPYGMDLDLESPEERYPDGGWRVMLEWTREGGKAGLAGKRLQGSNRSQGWLRAGPEHGAHLALPLLMHQRALFLLPASEQTKRRGEGTWLKRGLLSPDLSPPSTALSPSEPESPPALRLSQILSHTDLFSILKPRAIHSMPSLSKLPTICMDTVRPYASATEVRGVGLGSLGLPPPTRWTKLFDPHLRLSKDLLTCSSGRPKTSELFIIININY